MRIAVLGAGGVGGYFGARLAANGNDVTFMARGAHVEAMRRFLAAGGQTREGEAAGIGPLLDAVLGPVGPVGPPDPDLTGP